MVSSRWHNESGQGEEEVAAMTAAAMLSRGQRAADDAMRSDGGAADNAKRVTMTASDKIGRQMMQRKQAADDGSGAEDDQMYLPRVFFITVYNSFL